MQRTPRVSSLAAGLSLLALLLPVAAQAAQVDITITDNQFTPQSVTVGVGDTVVWTDNGSLIHTVTADAGSFNSGPIAVGQQFSATFNQPGVYPYHDNAYGSAGGVGMSGTITVSNIPSAVTSGAVAVGYSNPNTTYYANTSAAAAAANAAASGSGAVSSPTVASLYAQVQDLVNQINALQGQGGTIAGSSAAAAAAAGASGSATYSAGCPLIGRILSLGDSGSDVSRLQQFLASDPSVYPEGQVTGYYGTLTQAAVERWQIKYNIVSSGNAATTGYGQVGPRTAAAMSLQCSSSGGGSGGTASTGGGGGTVGGYITVSPLSGTAPLSVNATATVNTPGSCTGATYTLDFADGSTPQQIPVQAGNCSQLSQTYSHVYQYGGTYNIALSANGHQTTAPVTVSGPPAPASGSASGVATVANGTMSAFTTSGNAPFQTTFYVSCASGTAYNVVFGDGTDLGGTGVSGTKCGSGGLDAVSHTYTAAGSYQAELIIFVQQTTGTIVPVDVQNITISVSSVAANYTYNPPTLSPSGTALSFSLSFDLPTACTGYDVNWGDGTADSSQSDGGTSCAQTTTTKSVTHTYATTGSYTIVLRRGANLGTTNNIAVTVSD